MNRALYAKKQRQRWSNFPKFFLVKSSWTRTSHISFPIFFSLATIIFFLSGEYLVDHSGFFWLGLGCIVRHTYITLLIQCLCVMSARRFLARRRHRTSVSRNFFCRQFLFCFILEYSWFPEFFFLVLTYWEEAIHMISVEISSTRNDVRIPALNAEPLAGKSGSKGVDAETNIRN